MGISKLIAFNLNSKHLATGSECPTQEEGGIRIYSMRFCPYAQRALLVAVAKEIPFEVVNCNLKDKPEWLFDKNPEGKVPVLETPNGILYESLIVSDYLDEKYSSGRALHPEDHFQKALDRIWVERFNPAIGMFFKMAFSCEKDPGWEDNVQKLNDRLNLFEQELGQRKSKFFSGKDCPGMLDYMIWPWIERMDILPKLWPEIEASYYKGKDSRPDMNQWENIMKEDKAIREIFLDVDVHYRFTLGRKQGADDYDLLPDSKVYY